MKGIDKEVIVRLKSYQDTYLAACEDKILVKHVPLAGNEKCTTWILQGDNPEKACRLVSMYGEYLSATANSEDVIQSE